MDFDTHQKSKMTHEDSSLKDIQSPEDNQELVGNLYNQSVNSDDQNQLTQSDQQPNNLTAYPTKPDDDKNSTTLLKTNHYSPKPKHNLLKMVFLLVPALLFTGLIVMAGLMMVYYKTNQVNIVSDSPQTPGSLINQQTRTDQQSTTPEVFQLEATGSANVCQLEFTVGQNSCYSGNCINDSDCSSGLSCKTVTYNSVSQKMCVNSACPLQQNCICPLCNQSCNNNSECPSNLECLTVNGSKKCVNPTCPTRSDCSCPSCWHECSSSQECSSNMTCQSINGVYRCVNPTCPTSQTCLCSTPTPTPTATATPTPTPTTTATPIPPKAPELPKAGGLPPTFLFTLGGIVLVAIGLLL